jgi:2-hydroxy-3-oxopropionate reductase
MSKSGQKIGFIGLGVMGAPMALNLLKAGHIMFVQTRSKVPAELVEGGPPCAPAPKRWLSGPT